MYMYVYMCPIYDFLVLGLSWSRARKASSNWDECWVPTTESLQRDAMQLYTHWSQEPGKWNCYLLEKWQTIVNEKFLKNTAVKQISMLTDAKSYSSLELSLLLHPLYDSKAQVFEKNGQDRKYHNYSLYHNPNLSHNVIQASYIDWGSFD